MLRNSRAIQPRKCLVDFPSVCTNLSDFKRVVGGMLTNQCRNLRIGFRLAPNSVIGNGQAGHSIFARMLTLLERVFNAQIDAFDAVAVARLGSRLAARCDWREPQVSEKKGLKEVAERVGFEPTCRNYPTIRFRVGAVMTTSVPLRLT